jgi:hypothetical protein
MHHVQPIMDDDGMGKSTVVDARENQLLQQQFEPNSKTRHPKISELSNLKSGFKSSENWKLRSQIVPTNPLRNSGNKIPPTHLLEN